MARTPRARDLLLNALVPHVPVHKPPPGAKVLDFGCGEGKLLAFCRSGNRSTLAWAVARAEDGAEPEELHKQAQAAGFNLAPVAHLL